MKVSNKRISCVINLIFLANFQLSVSQILKYLPFFRMEIISKIFKFYIHINFHYLLNYRLIINQQSPFDIIRIKRR